MSFSFKRPYFSPSLGQGTQESKQNAVKEEDWGDDDDDEIMEKFVMAATQAEKAAEAPVVIQLNCNRTATNTPRPEPTHGGTLNVINGNARSQQITNTTRSFHVDSLQKVSDLNVSDDVHKLRDLLRKREDELILLKDELNQRSARIADVKDDLTKQNLEQKVHYEQIILSKENELSVIKTKLKFKEIDVQTLEQRCRKLELDKELASTEQRGEKQRKRTSGFDYFERDAFDGTRRAKPSTAVAAVQTPDGNRIRKPKRRATVLTHPSTVSGDVACKERVLLRDLKFLRTQLKSCRAESANYSAVQEALNFVRVPDLSAETVTTFSNICFWVAHFAPRMPDCADFLSTVLEPYLVENAEHLRGSFEIFEMAYYFCECLDIQFERRLPNLLILSAAVLVGRHKPQDCILHQVLNTKKKESLIKSLVDSYTEALKFILSSDMVPCRCYEEFMKQLYYSIEDNYAHYKKMLGQHISYEPTTVLVPNSIFLYSDVPTELATLLKEWSEKTSMMVPLFRRVVLNTGLAKDYNAKVWLISALQSLQLFKNLLCDENEDIIMLLGHLGNGDVKVPVLERQILEQSVKADY